MMKEELNAVGRSIPLREGKEKVTGKAEYSADIRLPGMLYAKILFYSIYLMTPTIGIIPARYDARRLPGKPLALIQNRPMIQHVYERAAKASTLERLMVATDDPRIYQAVAQFGGEVVMTSRQHVSGTDRVAEAARRLNLPDAAIVVNIQGDEPFIHGDHLESLSQCFDEPGVQIATLAIACNDEAEIQDPNQPKLVIDGSGDAMYFSRHPIPFLREIPRGNWTSQKQHYRHIGTYAYRSRVLNQLAGLPQSTLEKAESLEQLRWLEAGFRIKVAITELDAFSIDTPEDLEMAKQRGLINSYYIQE